jgi:hypothetical protein
MSDERIRELERAVAVGDTDAPEALEAALLRAGRLKRYTARVDDADEEIVAATLSDALAEAVEWAQGGCYDTEPEDYDGDGLTYSSVFSDVSVCETDDESESMSGEYPMWDADDESEEILPRAYQCVEDEHEWGDRGDDFGGVRSHGGIAMSSTLWCDHCGMRRVHSWDFQGANQETVSYTHREEDYVEDYVEDYDG